MSVRLSRRFILLLACCSLLLGNVGAQLPTVYLTVDSLDFWDEVTGIHVLGLNASDRWPHYGANWFSDREVPVHIAIDDELGTELIDQRCGLRIFGGASRGYAQKSFKLTAREAYGKKRFEGLPLQGAAGKSVKSFVLRNSGQDFTASHLRGGLTSALVAPTASLRLAYQPAVVYLNGEYWGIMNLREKISHHYAATHLGGDDDDYDVLGFDIALARFRVIEGEGDHYAQLLDLLESDLPGDSLTVEVANTYFDLDNLFDYYAAQLYCANGDWPGNNRKAMRHRAVDGKWHWVIYDTDLAYGFHPGSVVDSNSLAAALNDEYAEWPNPEHATLVFRRLMANETLRERFVARLTALLAIEFRAERVTSTIDSLARQIAPEISPHRDRWSLPNENDEWAASIAVLKSFAERRSPVLMDHVVKYWPTLGDLKEIRVERRGEGSIYVERSKMPDYPFAIDAPSALTLELEAVPAAGMRLSHWEGLVGATDPLLRVNLENVSWVRAVFEPLPCPASPAVRINEVVSKSDAGDWVELYNRSSMSVNLSGWQLRDADDRHVTVLPEGTTIAAGGYQVIAREPDAFVASYNLQPTAELNFGIANEVTERVRLFSKAKRLVDTWAVEPSQTGSTASQQVAVWPERFWATATPLKANTIGTSTGTPLTLTVHQSLGALCIELNAGGATSVDVMISTMDGRQVYAATQRNDDRMEIHRFYAPQLEAGLYAVSASSDQSVMLTEIVRLLR